MATDPLDPGTGKLLKRPRGRPATGKAMTDAERSRAYRRRQLTRLPKASHNPDEASTATLLQELGQLCSDKPEMAKWKERGKQIHQILYELARRFPVK